MSGLNPEQIALKRRNDELARLEGERKRPLRGLAAKVDKKRREAEKALQEAQLALDDARYAASLLRDTPGLTEKQLIALVKKHRAVNH